MANIHAVNFERSQVMTEEEFLQSKFLKCQSIFSDFHETVEKSKLVKHWSIFDLHQVKGILTAILESVLTGVYPADRLCETLSRAFNHLDKSAHDVFHRSERYVINSLVNMLSCWRHFYGTLGYYIPVVEIDHDREGWAYARFIGSSSITKTYSYNQDTYEGKMRRSALMFFIECVDEAIRLKKPIEN